VRKNHLQHGSFLCKRNQPVELQHLEEDAGDHGHSGLPVSENLSSRIERHIFIDDPSDAGFFVSNGVNMLPSQRF